MKNAPMTPEEILQKLSSTKSQDRKKAAQEIGKQDLQSLGNELLAAFDKELLDKKTWETQTAMIQALGQIRFAAALPQVEKIVRENLPKDTITIAAAKCYIRLMRESSDDAGSVIELLEFGSISVVTGALRVLAEDQIIPKKEEIAAILQLSWNINKHKDRIGLEWALIDPRNYLALACANWDPALTAPFLEHCMATAQNIDRFGKSIENTTLQNISRNSLQSKFTKGIV